MGFTDQLHSSNFGPLTSALGQKQTSDNRATMSALPPKADIAKCDEDVRFERTHAVQQNVSLFEQLVGAAGQRQWDGYAKRLGRLQIDIQLDFGCLLDR
jgi:hypothetical protein